MFCSKCELNWRKPDGNNGKDVKNNDKIYWCFLYFKEKELNNHLADGILSIFINVSSEYSKYLVFYEAEQTSTDSNDTESKINEENKSNSNNPSKRVKLDDYDEFIKRLKYFMSLNINFKL